MMKTYQLFVPVLIYVFAFISGPVQADRARNPVIWADVPDVAVIRVGDTYYMSSTTMHMSPGLPIMKSKNLVNWELIGYAYDRLVENDAMNLENGKSCYGRGSWASSLRYHNHTYYVSTFSSTSGRTHIYMTQDIEKGDWQEISFAPSLHDHSLFFDDDGRVYMLYGGGNLRLVELEPDLSRIKEGGFNEVVINNASAVAGSNIGLPAEGSQLRKIHGKYYVMNITWPRGGMRTQIIHRADKITGPYEGKVILQDKGVAQGCLIDTPDGKWYAMLFQDNGSVGRSPWLVPVKWEDGWPVLGVDGRAPTTLDIEDNGQGTANIVTSDEFNRRPGEALPLAWQWNHNPDNRFWSIGQRSGYLRLTTGRVDSDVLSARNMLTQRTFGPVSSATTKIDVANMKDGDYAGMIALQRRYGSVCVKMENGSKSIVMLSVKPNQPNQRGRLNQPSQPVEIENIPLSQSTVYLKIDCDFRDRTDKACFYYSLDGETWMTIGSVLQMAYTLPHFMGYRFGLFNFATKTAGGFVDFDYCRVSNGIEDVHSDGSSGRRPAQPPRPVAFDRFEYSGEDHTAETPLAPGQYCNPILAGFHPDPSLCRVGQDYYLINSTFEYFPGLPIFHSTDLVNWKQIGHVIHRPEQLDFRNRRTSGGLFAPAITYHEGLFYVICTMVDGPGNFVVTAENPAGPWSDPTPLRFGGIDPSIFFDDDGRAWIVNNDAPQGPPLYSGHRAIWIQELDYKAKKMVGPRTMLVDGGIDISKKPVWIEGPHLYRRNGWYYLCCAEGGTGSEHSQVILRSQKVDGPYTPWEKNPILTQRDLSGDVPGAVTCTGHADLEIGPDGNWWAVFLAVRPHQGGSSPMGRETFLLPVTWTHDDWPVILPPGQRVPLVGKSPNGVEVRLSEAAPFNGSFTWRDDFQQQDLSLEWIMLREPQEIWWNVNTTAGKLELTPCSEKLTGAGNPSYLGRRVRHATYTATLAVGMPQDEGVSAGMALFLNERHHYFLAVHRTGNQARLYLECVKRREVSRIAEAELPSVNEIDLRVEADKATCSFQYKLEGGDWETLVADADATMISFTVPDGLFLGATVGPHVRIDQ